MSFNQTRVFVPLAVGRFEGGVFLAPSARAFGVAVDVPKLRVAEHDAHPLAVVEAGVGEILSAVGGHGKAVLGCTRLTRGQQKTPPTREGSAALEK